MLMGPAPPSTRMRSSESSVIFTASVRSGFLRVGRAGVNVRARGRVARGERLVRRLVHQRVVVVVRALRRGRAGGGGEVAVLAGAGFGRRGIGRVRGLAGHHYPLRSDSPPSIHISVPVTWSDASEA